MGNLRIRRARPADLDVLIRELGQGRFFDDRICRQTKRLGMLLIAWQDDRPIGVIYLWLEDAEEAELREHLPGTPILNHLEIHPDHRGRGTGTKLIQAAERRLRRLGFRQGRARGGDHQQAGGAAVPATRVRGVAAPERSGATH